MQNNNPAETLENLIEDAQKGNVTAFEKIVKCKIFVFREKPLTAHPYFRCRDLPKTCVRHLMTAFFLLFS
jgi:hypothetical protein